MNKRILITVVVVLCFGLLFAFVGCTDDGTNTTSTGSNSNTQIEGAPAFQPADHEGRFESGGGSFCYGCHGAGENANPMLKDSVAIPEDHYEGESYDSLAVNPERLQCITCHPVE